MPDTIIKQQAACGWDNTVMLSNGVIELVVTLDVGPRVISCRHIDGQNLFKTFPEQLGNSGEADWQIRGGHRLWVAPESSLTYFPDNQSVIFEQLDSHSVRFTSQPEQSTGVQKSLTLTLDATQASVTVSHTLTAMRDLAQPVAAWALTVLAPGGIASIPQPMPAGHPGNAVDDAGDAYLPTRSLSLWSYTNLADPRFEFNDGLLRIHQRDAGPTKIGFLHQLGSVSYALSSWRFSKTVPFDVQASYPDHQSNLEVYTDADILELETLSPLKQLAEGEHLTHTEIWRIDPL